MGWEVRARRAFCLRLGGRVGDRSECSVCYERPRRSRRGEMKRRMMIRIPQRTSPAAPNAASPDSLLQEQFRVHQALIPMSTRTIHPAFRSILHLPLYPSSRPTLRQSTSRQSRGRGRRPDPLILHPGLRTMRCLVVEYQSVVLSWSIRLVSSDCTATTRFIRMSSQSTSASGRLS